MKHIPREEFERQVFVNHTEAVVLPDGSTLRFVGLMRRHFPVKRRFDFKVRETTVFAACIIRRARFHLHHIGISHAPLPPYMPAFSDDPNWAVTPDLDTYNMWRERFQRQYAKCRRPFMSLSRHVALRAVRAL